MAGGYQNAAGQLYATVGGGYSNSASGVGAFVGGGGNDGTPGSNVASGAASVIGGGIFNTATKRAATVGGGYNNLANGAGAFIGGGGYDGTTFGNNVASGGAAVISGGNFNQAGADYATVGGGEFNTAKNVFATVPGGYQNVASGPNSFAAGSSANATNTGAFVWSDNSISSPIYSTADNQFMARCVGGVIFTSGSSGGNQAVAWTPGAGSWSFTSDRNVKEGFAPVDARSVLAKLGRLPITEWNYIGYPQRHIGPMAQDWHALFPLNASDTTLNSADLTGISLAAIQGLYQTVQEKDARITALEQRLAELEKKLEALAGSAAKRSELAP